MKTKDILNDWNSALEEAEKTAPKEDLPRLLQEIDNRFNEVIDFMVFSEKLKQEKQCA